MRFLGAGCVLSLMLGGCGGSNPGTSVPSDAIGTTRAPTATYTEIADTTSTEDSALSYIGHTASGSGASGSAGTLDHDADTISGGLFAGTVNNGRTTINLTGGGTVDLYVMDGADYARRFSSSAFADPLFGVVGQVTAGADMPDTSDPTTTYGGASVVTIVDGAIVYTLAGNSTITADWANQRVDVELSGLDGQRDSGGSSLSVTDVAVVRLDDAVLSGAGFTGGSASVSGGVTVASIAPSAGSAGSFYGPGADEVGGVLLIDDSGAGVLVRGIYLAD